MIPARALALKKKFVQDLTAFDMGLRMDLQSLETLGRSAERLDRLVATSEFLEFVRPNRSSKRSAGLWSELYPVLRPQVQPPEQPVLWAEGPAGDYEVTELAPAPGPEPEQKVPKLLKFVHDSIGGEET